MRSILLMFSIFFHATAHAGLNCSQIFTKSTPKYKTITVNGDPRELLIYRPANSTQAAPVVIYFHGTNVPVDPHRPENAPYGLTYENRFIETLADAGFVVIAPTANRIVPYYVMPSVLAWEANVAPYSNHFSNSRDYQLVRRLFRDLETIVDTHSLDAENIFLAGFSSGGYMASRVVQEPEMAGLVRGIVLHSSSYGECIASQCSIPKTLPKWHPETLLVANKDDTIVPFYTVELYTDRLEKNKIPFETFFSESGDHAWKKTHPQKMVDWLTAQLSRRN
ncbi:hypothetical protein K2X05_00830 [bacterium]|nr:hypothetical protein [bacterium]